ncbi:MAG: phenylalanine--tRNA ligase subunit beta [Acidobacteria bacterium]|nr:phenylalanine--tRNA ligase subunit beta [Acidobacteriota bacterium]
MKISLHWLNEFVAVTSELPSLKRDLTMLGLNVESTARADDDWVLDLEVTTNRPDWLSHYGVAREVAAFYRLPLKRPEVQVKESKAAATSEIAIEIADPDLCARYCGRVIKGVEVKPSPGWLQMRLEAVGQRPINNVADVTNYVLLELGHPLHAFDLARVQEKKIMVRRARAGELLRTLDGENRTLTTDHLVIADGRRALALAGVMGGEESEISSATHDVLLESAWFLPVSIRRTAKSFGMRTEASYRFERGADIEMARVAIDRAAELIRELAGGEILRGVVDVYPRPYQAKELALRPSEVLRILGADVPAEEIERILTALGFQMKRQSDGGWKVTAPSYRVDISRQVDLIEEVARHYGYDQLPSRVRPAPPRVERDVLREKELILCEILVGLGYREIIAMSMVDPEENARFTDRPPVVLANPLSQEASALRSTPLPSMVRALRWNLDRDRSDLRLFEVGKTYTSRGKGLPDEKRVLTLGMSGIRLPVPFHEPQKEGERKEKELAFHDLKGDVETLLEAFAVPDQRFEPADCDYLEPGRGGRLVCGKEILAAFGEISGEIRRQYKLRQKVWLAEVDLDNLLALPLRPRTFKPFSKFPAVQRDFSLVVPEDVPYGRLAESVAGLGIEDIKTFRPVDLFPADSIAPGHTSLLLRVTFQSQTHTLTSDEITEASGRVLAALEKLGVRLRG